MKKVTSVCNMYLRDLAEEDFLISCYLDYFGIPKLHISKHTNTVYRSIFMMFMIDNNFKSEVHQF